MPPARSPDGPVHALVQPLTLEAALCEARRTFSSADVHVMRADILRMVNAVVREEQENPKKIDGALATMTGDLQLGIQCLDTERGRDAVYKALRPAQRQGETSTRLHQLLALGRAHRIENVTAPLQALIERNTFHNADDKPRPISGIVDEDIFGVMPSVFLTSAERKALRKNICSTYAEVRYQASAIAKLHRVLDVADYLGIDRSSIRDALEPGIESGLKHQIDESTPGRSYLEIGVFCAVAARRWKIRRRSPLTLPCRAASLFRRDMRKENFLALRQSYEKHVDAVFGRKHAPVARVLFGECLEGLQTRFMGDRASDMHARETHPEFYVPVHQFSGDAMRSLYYRDRVMADRASDDD